MFLPFSRLYITQEHIDGNYQEEPREIMVPKHFQRSTVFFLYLTLISHSNGALPNGKIKAVNLGGWLVTEGWIKPSLFDGIPNKDFLDGTQLQFRSLSTGKYLAAENGGGTNIVANRPTTSGWETFKVWRIDPSNFQFLVFNRQFVGIRTGGVDVVAVSVSPGLTETFQIVRNPTNANQVKIKGSNGLYLQAKSETLVTADSTSQTWANNDPSVFAMTIVTGMRGEYQVTNGYGRQAAATVMNQHWDSFIVESDFQYIASKGLNAVRIPVGWWIASDPSPPAPFVGGSLRALDNAFTWAERNNIGVIIDLHAAPGGQNAGEHGGSRDGYFNWGQSADTIQQTIQVIDFLSSRYGSRSGLLGVELMNEPRAPTVTLDSLKDYYTRGYDVVRKYTATAYVVMSNRLGPADSKELLSLSNGRQNVVIDVHYYNLFSDYFKTLSVQQNIDYIYNDRANQLSAVTTANGPLVLVGEWVAEWDVQGATKGDYQRFAAAQLDVYGRATFGWAYWTYKNVNNHWSLKWMIDNGYITL